MSDYVPADMVTHNYGLPAHAWEQLQKAYADHLATHPICERCRIRSSVRITPLGPIRASCMECIEQQRQEMIEAYNRDLAEQREEEEAYRRQQESDGGW